MYAFTRGNLFVGLTNSQNTQSVTITYHPYPNGQKLCNIFYPGQDCVTVQNGGFPLSLNGGETKILVPVSSTGEYITETFPEPLQSLYFLSEDY